mgnify:FL=1
MHNNTRKKSPTTIAFIGAIITTVGGFLISYNYIESQKIMAYDYMSNAFYNGNEVVTEENTREEQQHEELKTQVTNDYIGYLNIPKINLTKGFLDSRSEDNDVEKNILVVDGSNYPDVDKGNFILAGHSGTGWKAFFNDLHKLSAGDIAKITYKDKTYTYQIVNIYTQPKTGKLAIYRNYDKKTLTLITCTNNDSTTQTIYIAELTKEE